MLKLKHFFTNASVGEKSCPKNVMSVTAHIMCDNSQMINRKYFKFKLLTLQGDLGENLTDRFRMKMMISRYKPPKLQKNL